MIYENHHYETNKCNLWALQRCHSACWRLHQLTSKIYPRWQLALNQKWETNRFSSNNATTYLKLPPRTIPPPHPLPTPATRWINNTFDSSPHPRFIYFMMIHMELLFGWKVVKPWDFCISFNKLTWQNSYPFKIWHLKSEITYHFHFYMSTLHEDLS